VTKLHKCVVKYRCGIISLSFVLFQLIEPTYAQNIITTAWIIQPPVERVSSNQVKPGDIFLKQKLLPTSLARLEAPVKASGFASNELLEAGTQLIEAKSSSRSYYCTLRSNPKPSAGAYVAKSLLFGGRTTLLTAKNQYCFYNIDDSNEFDRYFVALSQVDTMTMIIKDSVDAKFIEKVKYTKIDPSELEKEFFVALKYNTKSSFGKYHRFQILFGPEERYKNVSLDLNVGDNVNVETKNYPAKLSVIGAEIKLLGEEGNNLTLQIEKPMDSQSFMIQTYNGPNTYDIYKIYDGKN
jgi:hypothetical protein